MNHNDKPLVSIVIPCYNHELYVQDCIKSVIAQNYEHIELIIIDDGSQDGSIRKIEELTKICEQRFVRFEFRSRANKGLSQTLNEAIEWCKGVYLSCIASDDMLMPNKTSTQVNFMQKNKNFVAVFSGIKFINENGIITGNIKGTEKEYNFKNIIMHDCILLAPTQMLRLETVRSVGGFDPNIIIEDWYMWLKLSEFGPIYCLSDYLSLYRRHDKNTSSDIDKMHKARLQILELYRYSEFYHKAYKEILWLRHYELLLIKKKNQLYHLIILLKLNSFNTTRLISRKISKIIFRVIKI